MLFACLSDPRHLRRPCVKKILPKTKKRKKKKRDGEKEKKTRENMCICMKSETSVQRPFGQKGRGARFDKFILGKASKEIQIMCFGFFSKEGFVCI